MKIFEEGLLGEWIAAQYLKRHHYKIIEKRYRSVQGEIDIIAREEHTLVFVEVKFRPVGHLGDGMAAITEKKRWRIRSAASWYMMKHPYALVRFDAIEISAAGIRHIKNAF